MPIEKITAYILGLAALLVAVKNIYEIVNLFIFKKPKNSLRGFVEKELIDFWNKNSGIILEQTTTANDNIEIVLNVLKILLGTQIEDIYNINLKKKTLTVHEQEIVNKYYEVYKNLGGNGHIEFLVEKMHSWTVIGSEKDEE